MKIECLNCKKKCYYIKVGDNMFELTGKFNTAKVFANSADKKSISQVINLLNQPFVENQKIRLMPDIHPGTSCTIGMTMTIEDKIVPDLVGADIGCGVNVVYLDCNEVDLKKLDEVIRKKVPFGYAINEIPHKFMNDINLTDLDCYFNLEYGAQGNFALGSLGGGNHFIELEKTNNNELILVVHSGSRRMGQEVCEYYQKQAWIEFKRKYHTSYQSDFIYCEGKLFEKYIHDMEIMQEYAFLNRKAIIETILTNMGLDYTDSFTTVHNYVDLDKMILRKGAVSALKNEKLIIPINMSQGSLICKGKGNSDWNYSAPHGAGRLLSRSQAKATISLDEFQKSMDGIYTTSISKNTLSESPMVYKPIESILDNIGDTVEILDIAKPIYNFKA